MPKTKIISQYLLAGLFVLAGIAHFLRAEFYARIVPPYIPWPYFMVYASGLCEIGLGACLLAPLLTRWAAWGLIALLVAVFPANVHMAVHADAFPAFSPKVLWLRLPMQVLLIWWIYWHTSGGKQGS